MLTALVYAVEAHFAPAVAPAFALVFALGFALGCTVCGGAMSEVLMDPRRSVLRSTAGAIISHPVVSTKTLRNISDYGPMWDRRRVLLSPLGGRRFFRGTTAVSYPDDAG